MSTSSQPLCISINSNIFLASDNFNLASWIILWHNKHHVFIYLPNQLNPIGSLPETLAKMLIPFLREPQDFMHCGPGGAWIENIQSNPNQTLFVEALLMPDQNYTSSSQQPNISPMFLTWYQNILLIIGSFRKQYFNLKTPGRISRQSSAIDFTSHRGQYKILLQSC
ncbi:hypothetical protein O181_007430 [Austropuccinia psidii MF-1]|uniref:Uncharacterized protein n=1 Tax=Austropuccinia psidii MF-1 TaxID=1389203 RepID=A0A9Q3BMX5_9BASI|nr:hypothetical protein [Austropuccinia psidii MF-1]